MTKNFSFYDQIASQSRTALHLYIDIETIPSQDPAVLEAIRSKHVIAPLDLDAVEPDKRLKDAEKIADDIKNKRVKAVDDHAVALTRAAVAIDDEYRKTALDASTGHIVCACVGLGDRDIAGVYTEHHTSIDAEREMLVGLFDGIAQLLDVHAEDAAVAVLKAAGRDVTDVNVELEIHRHRDVPVVVAHYANFDVRFVWQRAIILGITPPAWWPIDARPWDAERVQDTMLMWAGHGGRIGLDRLCAALGLTGKTGVDGSMVWDMVQSGQIQDIYMYCADDVRRLRSVHRRMIGLAALDIDAITVDTPADERSAA